MENTAPLGALDTNRPDPAGSNRVILEIQGDGALGRLKYERFLPPVQLVMDADLD